jgi:hypothetical protein
MSGLTLGSVALAGFEIPGEVQFGGAQALAVHKLPGGMRIIDVMGRDDADVRWGGVISGRDAAARARMLDAMRVAGATIPLSWDAFYYDVIIAELTLNYTNPWWIPYRIRCKVLADQAQLIAGPFVSDAAAISADLEVAASLTGVGAALAAITPAGALTAGTQANASALIALSATAAAIASGVATAGQQLQSADIPTAVSAAGSLAYLTAAQGYVGRASINLQDVSS